MTRTVLLTNPIEPGAMAALEAIATVVTAPDPSPGALVDAARDAEVVVVRATLPAALFATASRLLGVVRHGAGLDMVPFDAANGHGIAVANVPAVNARSVAEFVVGQMLTLARRATTMDRVMRDESWAAARALADAGGELDGKTLVVVGMGAIGQSLADICALGFGMRVIGVRRSPGVDDARVTYRTLDDAIPDADYLVLACPLTDETRGLIDADRLARMKPSARLVNVARGAVVVEPALIDALADGRIAGAALDVFDPQPLAKDSPLRGFPQVILSPHIAGITVESMVRVGRAAVAQVGQILDGEYPTHWVNRDAEAAIRARWDRLAGR